MDRNIASLFVDFAERECKSSSALYYYLSKKIALDADVLWLASECRNDQPVPNMLFAAVHYLLARESSHPLAGYYKSINASAVGVDGAFSHFKLFCLANNDAIKVLLNSRLVQTNEVRRCAYLYPAILTGYQRLGSACQLALIEVGTSAGLNLLPDQYLYSAGWGVEYGALDSSVKLAIDFIGGYPQVAHQKFPQISHRIGLDLKIIDLQNVDDVQWLYALIWPEHHGRRALLQKAIKIRRQHQLDLYQGDGFAMLEEIVRQLPKDTIPCIYHTHVANQISARAKDRLLANISMLGKERDLLHIYNNIKPNLRCTVMRSGRESDFELAEVEGHGRWVKWLAS